MSRNPLIYLLIGMMSVTNVSLISGGDEPSQSAKTDASASCSVSEFEKPMVIWFHNAGSTKPASLRKVLSCGVITHVLILYLHPSDAPLNRQPNVVDAVRICRDAGVSVIWFRTLWPTYNVSGFTKERLYDESYYADLIRKIREEARNLQVEFVGIDTEPYGYFPFKEELRKTLRKDDFDKMRNAVSLAVEKEGAVDFVMPAGMLKKQMFDAVVELGKLKIAEFTYYDAPWKVNDPNTPFDIFGAYISVSKNNKVAPRYPFFTAQEILERQKLWSHKKGIMLYPKEDEVEALTKQISKIKVIVPKND